MDNRVKYSTNLQAQRAIKESNSKYKKEKMTFFAIRFHNINDEDVINKLKSVKNKPDYLRTLIRADIEKSKQ